MAAPGSVSYTHLDVYKRQLEGCDAEELLPVYGDLAAIGTVADIMPLVGENRRIVKAGLALLQETDRPGLAALIRQCGLEGKRLTAENISFALAPRLNAAGRMDEDVYKRQGVSVAAPCRSMV